MTPDPAPPVSPLPDDRAALTAMEVALLRQGIRAAIASLAEDPAVVAVIPSTVDILRRTLSDADRERDRPAGLSFPITPARREAIDRLAETLTPVEIDPSLRPAAAPLSPPSDDAEEPICWDGYDREDPFAPICGAAERFHDVDSHPFVASPALAASPAPLSPVDRPEAATEGGEGRVRVMRDGVGVWEEPRWDPEDERPTDPFDDVWRAMGLARSVAQRGGDAWTAEAEATFEVGRDALRALRARVQVLEGERDGLPHRAVVTIDTLVTLAQLMWANATDGFMDGLSEQLDDDLLAALNAVLGQNYSGRLAWDGDHVVSLTVREVDQIESAAASSGGAETGDNERSAT